MDAAAPRRNPLTEVARLVADPLTAMVEAGGRLEAFARFQTAAVRARSRRSMAAAVGAPDAAPWPTMWAVEGAAFGWARERLLYDGGEAALEASLASAPERLLLPLHTGVGMALAWPRADSEMAGADVVAAAGRRLARPGCAAAVLEPLGFVTRVLRPASLPAVVAAAPETARPLLWHGGGRGIYFAPAAFRSGVAAAAFDRALEESPSGEAREATLAGVGWALTLVHLPRPRLVARTLEDREPRHTWGERRALLAGVGGALVVWTSVHGEERLWEDFVATVSGAEEHYRRQHAAWRESGWEPLLGAPGSWDGEEETA